MQYGSYQTANSGAPYQPAPYAAQNQGDYGYQQTGYQTAAYDAKPVTAPAGQPVAYGMGGGFVAGVPLYADNANLSQRFVVRGPRDVWAAVVFLIQIVITIIVGFANIPWIRRREAEISATNAVTNDSSVAPFSPRKAIEYSLLAVFIAIMLVSFALALMRKWPRQYIFIANGAVIAINVVVAIVFLAYRIWAAGICFLLCAALNALWLYCVRRRIPLAAELLGAATTVTTRHWGCVVTSFGACGVAVIYYIFFLMMAVPSYSVVYDAEVTKDANGNNSGDPVGAYILALVFLLMMYWSMQVIFNVVHVTAAGTVATWYFAGPENMPHNPSVASLKRAMTTSFGSICFGSLIVAILKLMHFMARQARHGNNGIAAAVAVCLLGCIERLIEYFNIYAYCHVAIYGSSFIEAAKQTWELVKNCVWSAVINDNLVYPVLNLTIFFNGIAVGVICGFAANNWVIGVLCFFIAAGIHIAVLRIVYSGVVTMFVCVAECPDALLISNPTLRQHLDDAIVQANQGC